MESSTRFLSLCVPMKKKPYIAIREEKIYKINKYASYPTFSFTLFSFGFSSNQSKNIFIEAIVFFRRMFIIFRIFILAAWDKRKFLNNYIETDRDVTESFKQCFSQCKDSSRKCILFLEKLGNIIEKCKFIISKFVFPCVLFTFMHKECTFKQFSKGYTNMNKHERQILEN